MQEPSPAAPPESVSVLLISVRWWMLPLRIQMIRNAISSSADLRSRNVLPEPIASIAAILELPLVHQEVTLIQIKSQPERFRPERPSRILKYLLIFPTASVQTY